MAQNPFPPKGNAQEGPSGKKNDFRKGAIERRIAKMGADKGKEKEQKK